MSSADAIVERQAFMGRRGKPFKVTQYKYADPSEARSGPRYFVTVANTAKGEVGRYDYYSRTDASTSYDAECTHWARIVGPIYAQVDNTLSWRPI